MRPITKYTMYAFAAVAMTAALPMSSAAAADAYLKLGDIKGESSDRSAAGGKIEVSSFQFGVTRKGWDGTIKGRAAGEESATAGAGGGGGGGAGKVSMQDMNVTTNVASPRDAASGMPTGKRQHGPVTISKPFEAGSMTFRGRVQGCAAGTAYRDATMVTRAYKYEFQDVVITSCATAGGGGLPMEEVSFNYGKIVTKYATDADKMHWDIGKNKKL